MLRGRSSIRLAQWGYHVITDWHLYFGEGKNPVTALYVWRGGLGIWGAINLLEGYGNDNPGAKSQGMKQLMAGGGVALIGTTLVPLLSGLFG